MTWPQVTGFVPGRKAAWMLFRLIAQKLITVVKNKKIMRWFS